MTGNRSTAVMQQRSEASDSLDDFPTHPWATRALCEMLQALGFEISDHVACDPACNRGFMAEPLREYFKDVIATDIHDYGYEAMESQADFLLDFPFSGGEVDWIITNPPFRIADDFIRNALNVANIGVAVLVRVAFDEGLDRYQRLFKDLPESFSFPFVERVPLHRGKLRDPKRKYWDPKANEGRGAWKKPSTATAYQWLVWLRDPADGPSIKLRIAPCRDRLIKSGDYPIRYDDEEGIFNNAEVLPLVDLMEGAND